MFPEKAEIMKIASFMCMKSAQETSFWWLALMFNEAEWEAESYAKTFKRLNQPIAYNLFSFHHRILKAKCHQFLYMSNLSHYFYPLTLTYYPSTIQKYRHPPACWSVVHLMCFYDILRLSRPLLRLFFWIINSWYSLAKHLRLPFDDAPLYGSVAVKCRKHNQNRSRPRRIVWRRFPVRCHQLRRRRKKRERACVFTPMLI
jgi:hypothetical protein